MKNGKPETFNGKLEQVREIAKLTGVSKKTVEIVLDAFYRNMKDKVFEQRTIHFTGIGVLTYKRQVKRITSHFTKEDYGLIEVERYPVFRLSKELLRSYCKKYRRKIGD